ncbi:MULTISPECIES: capsular polysaccharide export protein, LipB/KpsS family [Enterobacteriaceae]|uniref:capsular polysaccharide export protein, LipB/KpsS family n=1 Tax=Enterobacteriaceae TaxID=543 RepID=UPI001A8F9C1D|nr:MULTISPECIES: galactosyltransferase-related protein [Enterobacteriaceae]HCI4897625.1 glycosyltransferase [Escherichia coli]MBN9706683.1 glycosyltransferase [Enterobacter roggenkampii]MBW9455289.1 glycosyltransferase [Citrobacter portucalensis]MBW9459729.1 glycosyltransferase [Citrobacter portucalensis]HCI7217595.1 glycosyltransferase [Escherichia coli]
MSEQNKFTVSVIMPVRFRDEYDICGRLEMKLNSLIPDNYDFIVIDYGSMGGEAAKIKQTCESLGFKYIYQCGKSPLWNASVARNIGLNNSNSDYVIFEDVDLLHSKDFYYRINEEIYNSILTDGWPFLVVPVVYLSELGSEYIINGMDSIKYSKMIGEVFKPESEMVEHYAAASSLLVCNRKKAILIGGYDESFEGWGFEDSDFWVRLLMTAQIDRPKDFFRLDTRNYSQQVNWRGWRSLFRIFADITANKGIYSFHIWHPIAEHRSSAIRERNHKIFLQNCIEYKKDNYAFTPLRNENNKKQLFLSKNPHSYNEALFHFFDNPILIEERYLNVYNIEDVISENNISTVIFNNPYGTEERLAIYRKLKDIGFPIYVVERGSLPWSIYIDKNGFCCESNSYNEKNWIDTPFTEEKRNATLSYINESICSGSTLEPQGNMIGGANLKRKLIGESDGVHIVLIALQSPSDTTTRYFCGDVVSYQNYLNELSMLPNLLPDNWKVLVKNHPLSLEKFSNSKMINVDDCHIGDLLECCDVVIVLNSGVGIVAQLYGKHVFTFGQSHYSCDGLNSSVKTAQEVCDKITRNDYGFDKEKSLKFISFLLHDFYSFASWERKERKYTEKANLSISINIKYKNIRVFDEFDESFELERKINLKNSILFDRYRFDEYISRKNNGDGKNIEKVVNTVQSANIEQVKKSSFAKKMKKLRKNPGLYFYDGIKNVFK